MSQTRRAMRPISFALVAIAALFGVLRAPAFAETVDRIDIVSGIHKGADAGNPAAARPAPIIARETHIDRVDADHPARVGLWFGFERSASSVCRPTAAPS